MITSTFGEHAACHGDGKSRTAGIRGLDTLLSGIPELISDTPEFGAPRRVNSVGVVLTDCSDVVEAARF
jgi:hypothetical protein